MSDGHGLVLRSTDQCAVFLECSVGERSQCRNCGSDFASEVFELHKAGAFGEFPEDAVVGAGSIGTANGTADELCEPVVVNDNAFSFDERAGGQDVGGVLEYRGRKKILNDDGFDVAECFGLKF